MMFDENIPDMSKMDRALKNALYNRIFQAAIADPNVPENARAAVKMAIAAKNFTDKMTEYVSAELKKAVVIGSQSSAKKLNEITEYICLMSAGLDSFIEVWKHE